MAELLVELFSEEIPARMQTGAARDLERLASDGLKAAGLPFASLKTYAGPRRLTLVVDGLPTAQEDRVEERKGPRVDAPEQAVAGFLRSTGLRRDELVERDGVLFAEIARPGRPTAEIAAELVESIVRGFPWPKSMRWGTGTLRWVRPLKRIVLLFDGKVAPLEIDGIVSGDVTEGHRFMGSGKPFAVKDFADYRETLAREFVLLEADTRKAAILTRARQLCAAEGLELVEDEGLLEEVAGLAEHPVPILGRMDPAFLDLPPEVIRTSMRTHQKYFAVRDPRTGALAPRFLTVANIEASDGGTAIAGGNARVLSARLNDARFFWDEDLKAGFAAWRDRLAGMMFHKKLGSMDQRVERIAALAREIAPVVGADPDLAEQAARLCKADLASGMVGEFPELQGVMGGYYARRLLPAGPERDPIADAIRDHYKPVGPSDSVPTAPLTVAVSLADKLDTLTGFFAIDEKPTGSKDPYALRRAALGVIRTVLASGARLSIKPELLDFFADRLKVLLREEGRRHDLVDAVFALGDDDLVRVVARVEALDGFLATEDGANLLAGYRRAVNILKAEFKKDASLEFVGAPDAALFVEPEERALNAALEAALKAVGPRIEAEDFKGAMSALAALRAPVDAFFDKVLVNVPNPAVRLNRLRLLSRIEAAASRVADFDRIAG